MQITTEEIVKMFLLIPVTNEIVLPLEGRNIKIRSPDNKRPIDQASVTNLFLKRIETTTPLTKRNSWFKGLT